MAMMANPTAPPFPAKGGSQKTKLLPYRAQPPADQVSLYSLGSLLRYHRVRLAVL